MAKALAMLFPWGVLLVLLSPRPSTALSPLQGECEEPLQVVRVGLEWFLNADHMPFLLAERLGYFEELSLKVELVEPSDHWEPQRDLVEGRLDVAVTEPLHLAKDAAAATAEEQRQLLVGFARFLHTDGGVMYFANGDITRPRDMCGKTIQYPGAPGPGGPAIVQTMVEDDGGSCDVDSYGKVNFGFDHVGALHDKHADVATLIFANFEIPAARAKGHPEARYFSLKNHGVPDFCQLVLVAAPSRFPDLKPALRRLLLALRKAITFIQQDPESAAALAKLALPDDTPEETIKATLPMFPNDFSLASDYFYSLTAWLRTTGQLNNASSIDPALYWTNAIALP